MEKLCDFEIELLEAMAGKRPPLKWGAAVGAALGFLKGSGYVELIPGPDGLTYVVSQKGKDYLEAVENRRIV